MESECASCGEPLEGGVTRCQQCGYSPRRVLLVTAAAYIILSFVLVSSWTYVVLLFIYTGPFLLWLVVLLGFVALGLYGVTLLAAAATVSVNESLDHYRGVFVGF